MTHPQGFGNAVGGVLVEDQPMIEQQGPGSLDKFLIGALAKTGYEVYCINTRQMKYFGENFTQVCVDIVPLKTKSWHATHPLVYKQRATHESVSPSVWQQQI